MNRINAMLPLRRRTRRLALLVGAVAGLGVAAIPAAAAQASLLSPTTCASTTVSQPFLTWGDSNYYSLVPGGDFEGSLAGWTLTGGAGTVAGSEPYAATGTLGASSLYLPQGATAQSPYFCVDPGDPTFRFFAQNDSADADVVASIVYQGLLGTQVVVPVGDFSQNGTWQPSAAMQTGALLGSLLNGGSAQLALRFRAVSGPSQIDDVFVDPNCK